MLIILPLYCSTTSELKTVMRQFGERLTDEEVDDMISVVDLDGDGK